MAVGFIDELWCRNLINLFSTPLTLAEYMAGLLTVCLMKVMVGLMAASAIAWAAYSFDIIPWLPKFIPYMANLLLFALALGIAITGMIFRYTTKVQALAWGFAGLLMPVSCVMYPISSLPKWLQDIAWAMPTAHSFEGMRGLLNGGEFSPMHFWWGAGVEPRCTSRSRLHSSPGFTRRRVTAACWSSRSRSAQLIACAAGGIDTVAGGDRCTQ